MEPFVTTYPIQVIHLDATRRVTPAVLLHFVQETAGDHCIQLGLDWDTLAARGLFWAVIRHRLEIYRLPGEGDTVTVKTWPMPTTRAAFPRAAVGYDQSGKPVFRCVSLWVLMDCKTRQMILPGKSGIDLEGILLGDELPTPSSLSPMDAQAAATRQVWFSELDRNGHMNNTRYLDWAMDLLPPEVRRGKTPKEVSLCYLSEIRESDQISLCCGYTDEGIFHVDGYREQTDVSAKKARVFSAELIF
jgi:acyl-ACP thioesterase